MASKIDELVGKYVGFIGCGTNGGTQTNIELKSDMSAVCEQIVKKGAANRGPDVSKGQQTGKWETSNHGVTFTADDGQKISLELGGRYGLRKVVEEVKAGWGTNGTETFVVHKGVICDLCDASPIVGQRFRCDTCPDYDVCGDCLQMEPKHHAAHTYTEILLGGSEGALSNLESYLKRALKTGVGKGAPAVARVLGAPSVASAAYGRIVGGPASIRQSAPSPSMVKPLARDTIRRPRPDLHKQDSFAPMIGRATFEELGFSVDVFDEGTEELTCVIHAMTVTGCEERPGGTITKHKIGLHLSGLDRLRRKADLEEPLPKDLMYIQENVSIHSSTTGDFIGSTRISNSPDGCKDVWDGEELLIRLDNDMPIEPSDWKIWIRRETRLFGGVTKDEQWESATLVTDPLQI